MFNQAPGDIPKAHLNYLFFDVNYNYVLSGFAQVSSTNYSQLTNSFTADRDGYLFIYLANESTLNANVYFDDLEIKHSSSDALLQSDDYYPFGLPMNNGFQEAGVRPNRFLYQGKEWQKTLSLHLYDFHARQFDPCPKGYNCADLGSITIEAARKGRWRDYIPGWGNGEYYSNPVVQGIYDGNRQFMSHPATQGAIFAGTSLISGGLLNSYKVLGLPL